MTLSLGVPFSDLLDKYHFMIFGWLASCRMEHFLLFLMGVLASNSLRFSKSCGSVLYLLCSF